MKPGPLEGERETCRSDVTPTAVTRSSNVDMAPKPEKTFYVLKFYYTKYVTTTQVFN